MKTLINDGLRFVCSTEAELYRARTLLTKEPGTIQWLRENCREGDVVYDIGANIGCYTLFAARLVKETGTVFAFEPHVGNADSLLQNIAINELSERVFVLTVAINDRDGIGNFEYGSVTRGSSGSQFEPGSVTHLTVRELKMGYRLDALSGLRFPNLIKIDVDGNELRILEGAKHLLAGVNAPRSIQVEMPPVDASAIEALMEDYGYTKERIHYTASGQQQIDEGADPSTVIHNAIFKKAA